MIDPLTILVATPAYDGRVEVGYAGGLMAAASSHLFGNCFFLASVSNIALARNLMVHSFMRQESYQWMVFIDADIGFMAQDFKLLMDFPLQAPSSHDEIARLMAGSQEQNDASVTVNARGEALIVCAEYSRKVDTLDPARFGLGFCRIHRSVFERLIAATDDEGRPRIGNFRWKSEMYDDFFPTGVGFEGTWFGEDTGFFHLCRLAGIVPRIEQRTRLIHVGKKDYPYAGG